MVDRNLSESDDDDYDHYYNRDEVTLFFKEHSETTEFTVTKDTNIGDFIKKYQKKYNNISECTWVHFSFHGKLLDPYKTFGDYDIDDDETIHVVIRTTGC